MPDCSACSLYETESKNQNCLHVNRPGGLELTRQAVKACRLPAGAFILDAACGAGATLDFLEEQMDLRALGLDLSRKMLLNSRKHHALAHKIQASCLELPLPAAVMDAVLMECALSLSIDLPHVLAEFWRVLHPGGHLIVTDIYVRELNTLQQGLACLPASSCLSGARPEPYLREQFRLAGFSIIFWHDESVLFKEWLGRMVFKLGSLAAVYRSMVACDEDALCLAQNLGNKLKLGYYRMAAQKTAAD